MRVLVCGGRDFRNWSALVAALDKIDTERGITHVIHGEAPGADYLSDVWGVARCKELLRFPASWQTYGRAAGPIRNAQMLKDGKPDLVVAFKGGDGTANMIRQAREAGVDVIEVSAPSEPIGASE